MGTTIPCAPQPPGGKDTLAFVRVGSATVGGRSAGRSTTSAAGLSVIYPMRKQRCEIIRRRPSSRSGYRTLAEQLPHCDPLRLIPSTVYTHL
ncbi:hypothetical protein DPMN_049784 [Dreissena polymorpha]|uniref:Uncharacterized protein n=1 Tax=Dreissena polymorpha TaxID=45954 RepID=A0A9D4HMF6_DREPO|nr:hypothetical protein DPMN_049784 [Dreissena polymorpha]